MYLNLFDSHTHSEHSPDAAHSVDFLCESAIANGVLGIAVTDHCDIDGFDPQKLRMNIKYSNFDAIRARETFAGRLYVSAGIELGQPYANIDLAREIVAANRFDFLLGTQHSVPNSGDFSFMNYNETNDHDLLVRYYTSILQTIELGLMDSLAHLTYPFRYINGFAHKNVPISRFDEYIEVVLKSLVEHGKGLEINTSGLRQGVGETLPPLKYVRWFRELGGEIITIGSDAHRAEHIGANIADGMAVAEEAGFRYFAFFKERVPRMLLIH